MILDATEFVSREALDVMVRRWGCRAFPALRHNTACGVPPVRVQFSASPGVVSPGIQFFTHWRYGHCEFRLSNGWTLGAHVVKGSGVWPRPWDYQPVSRILVCDLDAPPEVVEAVWREAWRLVGTPYDFKWFLGFCVNRDWNDDSKLGCSEDVVTACINAGLELHDYGRHQPNKITPADVSLSSHLRTIYEGPPEGYP